MLAPLLMLLIAVSRWARRLDGVPAERMYDSYPDLLALLPDVELTGNLPPVVPDRFSGYTHRPGELVQEIAEAGLALEDLVRVEGMPVPLTVSPAGAPSGEPRRYARLTA